MLDKKCKSALCISEIDKEAMWEFQVACSFEIVWTVVWSDGNSNADNS